MSNSLNTLFVWREFEAKKKKKLDSPYYEDDIVPYFGGWGIKRSRSNCPFCKTQLEENREYTIIIEHPTIDPSGDEYHRPTNILTCPLCGWKCFTHEEVAGMIGLTTQRYVASILREFEIDSTGILISELGEHLKNNFSDIYNISWRKFEELAKDIFHKNGFYCNITQPAKDGGADLLILDDGSNIIGIVECKKYKKTRKVGVDLVRNLVGASILYDVKEAYLVTTSEFTSGARKASLNYRKYGFNIELIAASELLKQLQVYNKNLPSLQNLSLIDIEELVNQNRILLKQRKK